MRLLPPLVVLVVADSLAMAWGVSAVECLTYGLYLGFVVALPGWVLWRLAGPTLTHSAEELALGAAVGYALETLSRIVAVALGLPSLLGDLAPLAVALAVLSHPGLRGRVIRPWVRLPGAVAWSYAGLLTLVLVWFGFAFFARQPLEWTGDNGPENDLLFALALAGEARHHWPMEFPWVRGEPLLYHWFFAQHLASAAEVSRVGLPTLVLRLDIIPAVVITALAVGATAVRLSARAAAGPVAAGLLFVVQDAAPIPLTTLLHGHVADLTGPPYDVITWWSTSGAFGAVVFAPIALLLVDLSRGVVHRMTWPLLLVLLVVGAGAKASILPVTMVAAGSVVVLALLRSRRWHWPGLAVLGLSAAVFSAAWRAIYGRESQGLVVAPLKHVLTTTLGSVVLGEQVPGRTPAVALGVLVLCLAATCAPFAGLALVLTRGQTRRDPAARLCLGAATLGLAGVVLLYHQGQSNLYFLRTALPLLVAAAAWGLVDAVERHAQVHRARRVVAGAAVLGVVSMAVVSTRDWFEFAPGQVAGSRLGQAVVPFLLVLSAGAMVVVVAHRWFPGRQAGRALLVCVLVAFVGGAGALRVTAQTVVWSGRHPVGWSDTGANPSQQVSAAGAAGARWIRDNSDPQDLVLTNAFCRNGSTTVVSVCDNRTFWVSAYSERRTELSGWGYTARANALAAKAGYANGWQYPFWDQARLSHILEFLRSPTESESQALRRSGVRWVLVVPGYDEVSPALASVAERVFEDRGVAVYRLDP